MLNRYFVHPTIVDRIRASWIGRAIEHYVDWLAKQNYAARNVFVRVPLLMQFGEFAKAAGASSWEELPAHVESFLETWLRHRGLEYSECQHEPAAHNIRNPIWQLLRLILPNAHDYEPLRHDQRITKAQTAEPFADVVPNFFEFLRRERGLREGTIGQYRHYLRRLQDYLQKINRPLLPDLPPRIVTAFITQSGESINKRSVQTLCSILKVFFRYLYRVGLTQRDLSKVIESPRRHRLANVPRSITWKEVEQMLNKVDRRSGIGRRDYAILMLLVRYGLRAREVGAMTLDDIDWKHDHLQVSGRKAGHSTIYPLATNVGEAILDYLKQGRPETTQRVLFFAALAPYKPLSSAAVSLLAKRYLRKAGVVVPRPGSHTLRHTCVQRLVDSGFALKTIGDYVGHRTPLPTRSLGALHLPLSNHFVASNSSFESGIRTPAIARATNRAAGARSCSPPSCRTDGSGWRGVAAMTYNPLFRPLENDARADNETNTGDQATSHISSYPCGVSRDGARSGRST